MATDDLLRGNFKVKNPVKESDIAKHEEAGHEIIAKELKKRALASLGGSMVYVERETLTWSGDGDEGSEKS